MQATVDLSPAQLKLIAPFVSSVRNLLATMIRTSVTIGQIELKEGADQCHDVSGIIGFSGGIAGSVVVGMSTEVAMKLVAAFAGAAFDPDSSDFIDAIGELANMIAGSAKKNMGVPASISIPTVIVGSGHHTATLSGVPCVVIPCITDLGTFKVEVNIKQTI
jgi:chemotaxis protein CheX